MTPIEWLEKLYDSRPAYEEFILPEEFEQAKQMEKERLKQEFIAGYNIGYTDAQCNHINDADNTAQEREYIRTCEYSGLPSVQSYEDPR